MKDLRYAGFWARLLAMALDRTILFAVSSLVQLALPQGQAWMLFQTVFWRLAYSAYEVFMVGRFGGSPGKLLLGMRVTMVDGSPATWRAAWFRIAIELPLGVATDLSGMHTLMQIPEAELATMNLVELGKRVFELETRAARALRYLNTLWVYVDLLTMLSNQRRRSVHDFLANTVVIFKAKD